MAQYYDDFSVGAVGSSPAGWTQFGDASQRLFIYEDPTAINSRAMRLHVNNFPNRYVGAAWDAVSADPNRKDVKVLSRLCVSALPSSNVELGGFFSRGNVATIDWCGHAHFGPFSHSVSTREGGIETEISTQGGLSNSGGAWRWFRYECVGTELRGKAWMAGDAEPNEWGVQASAAAAPADGAFGVFQWMYARMYLFDFIAVGTGGDEPPLGPVGSQPPSHIAPANASSQPQPITLEWASVAGATSYHIQVATDIQFTTLVIDNPAVPTNSLQISGLDPAVEHWWRVGLGGG